MQHNLGRHRSGFVSAAIAPTTCKKPLALRHTYVAKVGSIRARYSGQSWALTPSLSDCHRQNCRAKSLAHGRLDSIAVSSALKVESRICSS